MKKLRLLVPSVRVDEALDSVGVELIVLDSLRHGAGLLNLLGAERDLLHRDGLLADGHLVLVEGNGGLIGVGTDVILGLLRRNRGALDADLFAGDRNLDGLGLLYLVLAEASFAGSDTLGTNIEALLLQDDVVGNTSSRGVQIALSVVDLVLLVTCVICSACSTCSGTGTSEASGLVILGGGLIRHVGLNVLDVGEAVVLVDAVLVGSGELVFEVDLRGILDKVLVKSELELVTLEVVAAKRNQAGAQAKQAMVDLDEGGLTGLIINEQVVDLAQLLPLASKAVALSRSWMFLLSDMCEFLSEASLSASPKVGREVAAG